MDGLCGTSSLWLTSVSAIEPKYNKNGKCKPQILYFLDLFALITDLLAQ